MSDTYASYDGGAIFGRSVKMRTLDNPSADQINNFFGANGQESLFGGTRGAVTFVEGVLFGTDRYALDAARQLLRSYNDGYTRTLVDTIGRAYPQVKYGTFEPGEKIHYDPTQGYFMPYKATFIHLA